MDNKEAPLRLCTSGGPHTFNFELKALDATANPHLALAAVILAGCEVRAQQLGLTGLHAKGTWALN